MWLNVTGNTSAPRNTHEREIDRKISDYLKIEDPNITIDLHEHRHSESDKYKQFWAQCRAYLQEVTTAHERQHDQVTYILGCSYFCS